MAMVAVLPRAVCDQNGPGRKIVLGARRNPKKSRTRTKELSTHLAFWSRALQQSSQSALRIGIPGWGTPCAG